MAGELNLSNLKPAQERKDAEARRPRPGLGQGALLRPRDQGPEVARRLAQDARRLRGRPDARVHAHGQAARLDLEGRDADRAVPHLASGTSTCATSARFDAGTEVTPELLKEAGLIRNLNRDVKVLGHGDLAVKLTVSAHAFSKSAAEKIEAAGGSVTWLKPPHEKKKRRHKKAAPAAAPEAAAAEAKPADDEAPTPRRLRRGAAAEPEAEES